jgi:hypothetical protein
MSPLIQMDQIEKLLSGIQSSRNSGVPVLYGNDLQENSGIYYRPESRFLEYDVPPPPARLFRENGATTEIDNRAFIEPSPQVPRNPELEALNDYFRQQRTMEFARQRERAIVPEALSKQAEMMANSVVRDEIERRSGIRKAVLEATGLTPAQVQVQMAQEQLGGVNGRVIDMRDRQVQDAVNMYYLINNIPPPATAEATADKVPSNVAPPGAGGKEVDEDEAGQEFVDGADGGGDGADAVADEVVARRFGEEFPVMRPEVALPETPEEVNGLSKQRLAEIITAYRMYDPVLTTRSGSMMTSSTMVRTIEKELLVSVVLGYLARRDGAGRRRVDNRAGGGVGNVAGGGGGGDDEW